VTPYSEAQWRAIDSLARRVDADLTALDVRLTQGGEPTFVAMAGGSAPEWNYTADGSSKRRLAARLLRRLHARFAPQGLMLFGQGKWYPGEPLPRWAFGLYWRVAGAPLWREPALIADEETGPDLGMGDAENLLKSLAHKLGTSPEYVMPAFEDPWPALDLESRLPPGVDPLRGDLGDVGERTRLARLLRQGLGSIAGYCLPLRAVGRKSGVVTWKSGRWPLKRERMYLVPGDSPAGFRLPLDSLPADNDMIRTAVCVEVRGGRLRVFLPPLDAPEEAFSLILALEECSRELGLPVIPEGYEPPAHDALRVLKVTPDPGVIEVNVHPAAGWDELCAITVAVYEEAEKLGLAAEKFNEDGRRAGTGGGNHITLGGATPAESPLLRRPDLLRSLITYWLNHPGLSYLFSGQYIGPTSQAPRIDEARESSLYELEIAFQELDRLQAIGKIAPDQVDRLLRDLLVDVTGNTHRAEFCIDKLSSPDGPAGQLGLLELRGFEMAPDARMAAAQYLLVRAMVARFWKTPYREQPIRWGPSLHDRFLLPHYVAEDMQVVVSELRAAGYPYSFDWLEPFLEFRFPLYGKAVFEGITLELRHALEPWPVLGEAATASGTSRSVDASLDRLQVKVSALNAARHVLLCNGRRVPLRTTGSTGEQVAGVRYRARMFPSVLHPTIGVQSPLAFDVVDAVSGRSLGGCSYYSGDPGGKPYSGAPTGEAEAAARRKIRFVTHGPGSETIPLPREMRGPDGPCTLDLRLQQD